MENNKLETRNYSITAPRIFFESFEKLFDTIIKDASTASNFKRLDPLSKEQEVARFNAEHSDQHTSIEYLSKEQVIERYGYEFAKPLEQNFDGNAIIPTSKYCKDAELKYGMYGQHFKLPLTHKFAHGDMIECGHKDLKPLWITGDPIDFVIEHFNDGTKLEYWLHTVKIATNNPDECFYPRKFLLPGTRFHKIPDVK